MIDLLIILPLLIAALVAPLLKGKRQKYIRYIALCASVISLILIAVVNSNLDKLQSITWFSFSGYQFALSTSTMPLNMILLAIVGTITPLIITYSIGFMNVPSEQSRYYSELCIFAAAMMLFAMAGDFITMLIGWELLGVTSYLLIGFWYQREGTAQAARKAVTTILIGDVLMLLAMLVIWNTFHTFGFAAIIAQSATQSSTVGIALVLIMLAVFTKSAQFPFHEWLPYAMKGPTPVSAYLHSSTMVKAGVFLIAVLLPLFVAYHLLYLLLIFGAITAIIGATNALTEFHIKRVLAYSTIEDLGLMFIALGTGSIIAAMLFFVVQTFYKALLFMSAGSIMKANNNEENLNKIYNPPSALTLFIPTLVGVLSLAGLFPLSGFFGKVAIESSANNIAIYLVLILIELLSSIYIFRWLFLPIRKKTERRAVSVKTNYKTMPKSMIIPIYLLAILVFAASYSYIFLPGYLSGSFVINKIEIIISSVIVALGILAAYLLFYKRNYFANDERNTLYRALNNNVIANQIYLAITSGVSALSSLIDGFDYVFYVAIKHALNGVTALANQIKRLENGNTNSYIAIFVIGLIVILILFAL